MKIPFTNYHITIRRKPQRKLNNLIHPDYKKYVEYAFSLEGVDYYQFAQIGDMPTNRYYKMTGFLEELQLRLDRETLLNFVDHIEQQLNNGNLGRIGFLLEQIKYRADLQFETDTFYRFATAVFFTLDEPLESYDYDVNESKLQAFKKAEISDFFLKEPVRKLIPLQNISAEIIEAYLKESKILRKYEKTLMQQEDMQKQNGKEA